MTIDQYVDTINKRYKQGNTTEYSFRGDLLHLLTAYTRNSEGFAAQFAFAQNKTPWWDYYFGTKVFCKDPFLKIKM
jgi:hypothetical protein